MVGLPDASGREEREDCTVPVVGIDPGGLGWDSAKDVSPCTWLEGKHKLDLTSWAVGVGGGSISPRPGLPVHMAVGIDQLG